MLENIFDVDAARLGRALRRTRITALGLGVVSLVVAAAVGYPLVGLGITVGLVFGAINTRWIDGSVTALKNVAPKASRRPLAMRTLARLAVTTAVVLLLLFFVTAMGFGVLGGLVLYQAAFLSSMIGAVFQGGAPS
jgi:hypothetical protein